MEGDKVQTGHPAGKRGVRIDRAKYDMTREAIRHCLSKGDLTQKELVACASQQLEGRLEGSVAWYMETVKLDLEAKGEVERYRDRPHDRYRLKR